MRAEKTTYIFFLKAMYVLPAYCQKYVIKTLSESFFYDKTIEKWFMLTENRS
jgi:hypothetical protein